jgi:hypothetical protein
MVSPSGKADFLQPGSQFVFFHHPGAQKLRRPLVGHQNVQALEIERQTNQAPFSSGCAQTA